MERQDDCEDKTPFLLSAGDLLGALLFLFVISLAATMLRVRHDYDRKVEMADSYKGISEEHQHLSATYARLAETYRQLQDDLHKALLAEFAADMAKWRTVIDRKTLAIRFQKPEVLFGQGGADVTETFKEILDDFFPRYIRVLMSDAFRDQIDEIRIEGHTSSEWFSDVSGNDAYFENMRLSQDRTRNVLRYCLGTIEDRRRHEWIQSLITANGLSSSKRIFSGGAEDKDASRRVEFRVRTRAEERISDILGVASADLAP